MWFSSELLKVSLGSVEIEYPVVVAILPLLFFIRWIRGKRSSVAIPVASHLLAGGSPSLTSRVGQWSMQFLHLLFLCALALAAARPVQRTSIAPNEMERRNVMLALDVSRSMEAQDFASPYGTVSRMEGVKSVTRKFFENRADDRIGLVLFGSQAYLQSPLTIDHSLLARFISELQVGIAGDGTALGDGLGVALKRIEELPSETQAVILLTDGVSNSGSVDPIKAAGIARDLGVRVYTIGIGSHEGAFLNLNRGFSIPQRIRAEFDEATLRRIAEITGGKYYFASDAGTLNHIYEEIDSLEKSEEEEKSFELITEFYPLFAGVAALVFLLHFVLSQTVFGVYP
ncbi:MAG: VWA domain-containing protein [Bdellovibrionales bacterium]|nr:VWA domain-containing protein [Bdellovibrionales bacterium]